MCSLWSRRLVNLNALARRGTGRLGAACATFGSEEFDGRAAGFELTGFERRSAFGCRRSGVVLNRRTSGLPDTSCTAGADGSRTCVVRRDSNSRCLATIADRKTVSFCQGRRMLRRMGRKLSRIACLAASALTSRESRSEKLTTDCASRWIKFCTSGVSERSLYTRRSGLIRSDIRLCR